MSIDEFTLSTIIDIEKNIQTNYNLNGSVFYDDQYIFACSLKFDTILIDINTEKVAKQFDDTNDYFGLVDLWKQIPQSFKDINLTKYLKGFKDDSMFEERGHPSIKGHKEIVELLKDKI